jgi:hypothetical protein
MTGPVVEWARRWLGVSQLEAENRRLTLEVRALRLSVEQLERNISAAERIAVRAQASGDPDSLGRIFAVLRRGR